MNVIFENYYNILMKIILSLILLIAVVSAFQIRLKNVEVQREGVGYPFTICSQTGMPFTSLTLDKTPTLNINLTATAIGQAKKDLSLNYTSILILTNGTIITIQQEDFKYTFKNGETINFTYTYEIPQFQTKGAYTIIFSFFDINDNSEGCVYYKYSL